MRTTPASSRSAGSAVGNGKSAPDLDAVAAKAIRIYEEQLKTLLEAAHLGQIVAIHPDTGDYHVGKNSPVARHTLRQRRSEGAIVTMSIGPQRRDPALDRMLGNS